MLGSRLRALRTDRDETLAQTAERAGISPQYLSEIERGRKEASSEMIAALAGALGVTVAELMAGTAEDLRRVATPVIAVTTVHRRSRGQPGRDGPSAAAPVGPGRPRHGGLTARPGTPAAPRAPDAPPGAAGLRLAAAGRWPSGR